MPDYIGVEVETDPDLFEELAYDYLRQQVEGWEPNSGTVEVWLIQAAARLAAEVRDIASQVPTTIFRYYGASIMGIPPIDATSATAESTWTMKDTAGYTIPAGTLVGIRSAGDTLIAFETIEDQVIDPGDSSATDVVIESVEPGQHGTGLGDVGTVMELIDSLEFVTQVTLEGTTSGGVDDESDTDYLLRLASQMALLAPRPIIPYDFEVMAKNVAGIDRALAVDLLQPGVNEIQQVAITGGPTGGSFQLIFSGQTAVIQWNSTAAALQTALEGLSNINVGDVFVSGGPFPATPITVEFRGQYAEQNVAAMTIGTNSLTGGTTPTPAVTTPTAGAAPTTNNERMVTVFPIDEAGEALSAAVKAELDDLLQAEREINFIVHVRDPVYNLIDVTFTAIAHPEFDPVEVEVQAEEAIREYLSPVNWGQPEFGDERRWVKIDKIRIGELYTALNRVEGLNYVTALTFALQGQSLATTDVTLIGSAPLPRAGQINGTVT